MASAFTHRNFYTEPLLHTEKLLHTASFYTQNLLHTASFYRKKILHTEAFLYIVTTGIAAPKSDLDAKATKRLFWSIFKRMFKKKITSAKIEKSADKSLSQPWCSHSNTFQYYLRDPAAKDNSITHAAAARSNLDAAITMRSAETDLRNTIELRATASEIASPKPDPDAKAKKRRFWSTFDKDFEKENC